MYLPATSQITQQNRMFQTIVGMVCALVTLVCVAITMLYAGLSPLLSSSLLLVVGIVTCATFYPFRLLLSARNTSFMLLRASWLWLRACVLIGLGYFIVPGIANEVPRVVVEYSLLASYPSMLLTLTLLRISASKFYSSLNHVRTAILIAPGPQALLLAQRLMRTPTSGIRIAGYFGTALEPPTILGWTPPRLGDLQAAIPYIVSDSNIQIVFIDSNLAIQPAATQILTQLGDATAAIYIVPEPPPGYGLVGAQLAGLPVLALHETGIWGLARLLKRSMDIAASMLALLLLSPLLALIALGVLFSSPGPVIFRQCRAGEGGRPINICKFRSMYISEPKDKLQQATRNDSRITRFGKLLRRTSLDELPQLFNVLRGDMSLVGPRPHAVEHDALYRKQIQGYMLRYTIKPGITGWAQVNGLRGETDTIEKMRRRVEFDRYYIAHWSPMLDLRILCRTIWLIFHDHSAY